MIHCEFMDSTLVAAIISAIISGLVSWVVSSLTIRHNDKSCLENELSDILKIGIEHPYLEQESFTSAWEPSKQDKDERYATYELYATLVFNHLEKRYKFYSCKLKRVQEELDMVSWVKLHKAYWTKPTTPHENILGYNSKFSRMVDNIIKGKMED